MHNKLCIREKMYILVLYCFCFCFVLFCFVFCFVFVLFLFYFVCLFVCFCCFCFCFFLLRISNVCFKSNQILSAGIAHQNISNNFGQNKVKYLALTFHAFGKRRGFFASVLSFISGYLSGEQ